MSFLDDDDSWKFADVEGYDAGPGQHGQEHMNDNENIDQQMIQPQKQEINVQVIKPHPPPYPPPGKRVKVKKEYKVEHNKSRPNVILLKSSSKPPSIPSIVPSSIVPSPSVPYPSVPSIVPSAPLRNAAPRRRSSVRAT